MKNFMKRLHNTKFMTKCIQGLINRATGLFLKTKAGQKGRTAIEKKCSADLQKIKDELSLHIWDHSKPLGSITFLRNSLPNFLGTRSWMIFRWLLSELHYPDKHFYPFWGFQIIDILIIYSRLLTVYFHRYIELWR